MKLAITLKRSGIGACERHKRILKGLGLTKREKTVVRPDTPEIRGMVNKVLHLLQISEIEG